VLNETSSPSYSQVPRGEEQKSPTAPLYPEVNGTLVKAMPASTISDSSETTIPDSVETESSEFSAFEPLHKSRIDRQYERFARRWGFDDTKTKEENIDIIQQKVNALEERLAEQRFPRDEDEIELEGGKNC